MKANYHSHYQGDGGGVGFCGFLTLMFVAFKILGIINWSWWWVLSPIWIPILIGIVIGLLL